MRIEHVMTRDPVTCDARDTVEAAAKLMASKGVGAIVVLRGGKVAGLLIDRQLACCVIAEGLGPGTPVEDVMTEDPVTVKVHDTIFTAVDALRSAGVARRVPVMNDRNELVGIVSISDIAVVAQKLLDAVMLDATHSALNEAHVPTGGKRVAHTLRQPTQLDGLTREPGGRPATVPATAERMVEPKRVQEPQGLFSSLLGRKVDE